MMAMKTSTSSLKQHACVPYEKLPTSDFVTTTTGMPSLSSSTMFAARPSFAQRTGEGAAMNVLHTPGPLAPDGDHHHHGGGTVLNSMYAEGNPKNPLKRDVTIGAAWDSGNLCGCCANGRGCAGFGNFLYACICPCSVQSEVIELIGVVRNRPVNKHSVMKSVLASMTKTDKDDQALTFMYAWDLQERFSNPMDTCKLSCLSFACPTCMLTYAWHTAKGLRDKMNDEYYQRERGGKANHQGN